MKYGHDKPKRAARVAEPVQVYLERGDRERLERLTTRLDTTKSDVLRRGLEILDAQTAGAALRSEQRLALPTFRGKGLLPGYLDDTAALLDLMAEKSTATR